MSEWLEFVRGLDSQDNLPTQEAKEKLGWIESEMKQEQKTVLYLAYLTTLARLPVNRDLDELFDGEIQLWEEEMFSIYSLIEIINWSNYLSNLKAPKSIELDRDWDWSWWPDINQDYSYKLDYEDNYFLNGKQIPNFQLSELTQNQKNNLKIKKHIKSIKWDWYLPLNETKLTFSYDSHLNTSGIKFERPTNWIGWWWLWVDQEISFSRNDKWLVDKISILRDYEVDNELSIIYNSLWKPEIIEQTKLWLSSDKIVFEYDDNWDLISIIYVPTLSLKHLKWFKQALKPWKNTWKVLKWLQIAWEYVTFKALKMAKWNDVITINNTDWLPNSTTTNLSASNWLYKEGFSKMKYWDNKELQELYLEMEDIWPDDKKTIKLKY